MYRWVVFLHVVGVFGFLFAHGAAVLLSFALGSERKPERISALLDLSATSRTLMYWSLGLLLAAGITAGFLGGWWGHGWIWAALALLVLIVVLVVAVGIGYFRELRRVVAGAAQTRDGDLQSESEVELATLLASPRPRIIAVGGSALLVVILWLMMFKPF